MLIHNMLMLIALFYIFWSFIVVIWSALNREKSFCVFFFISSLVGMAYLFVTLAVAPGFLETPEPGDLEFCMFGFLVFPVYIISLIINSVKLIKYRAQEYSFDTLNLRLALLGMIIIPIICVGWGSVRDYYRIRHSDAIVIIYSRRDTKRLLDNETFGFVIRGDKVHRFDFMLDAGMVWFTGEGFIIGERNGIKTRAELGEYEVLVKDDDIYIDRGDNTIFTFDSSSENFYSNEIHQCYYRE